MPDIISVPTIYEQFHCKADKCLHTCCRGWEIDIDPETRSRYAQMTGPMADRLKSAIEDSEDGAFFRLSEDERCPFLASSGLCDLICACGEDALCQICRDHPRYRNEFSTFTEVGLGLCCEEAAALTLHHEAPMRWHFFSGTPDLASLSEEEATLLSLRNQLITIMQRRDQSILHRLQSLCAAVGHALPNRSIKDWADFLLTLERLDPSWTDMLTRLAHVSDHFPDVNALWVEQFVVYLLHRHLPDALLYDDLPYRVLFCATSGLLIAHLFALYPDEINVTRMFSSEIEYSDENLNAFLDEMDAFL